jgi:hypothetical protein
MSGKKSPRAETAQRIREAEKAVEAAKAANRAAFRQALVELFNGYGLRLEADGDLSAHLTISELRELERVQLKDIPE